MSALTNLTEAAPSYVSPSDYYIWDEPEGSVSIHLNYQTVDNIQIEVLRALDSNTAGGMEIGGILLGRREQSAERVNTFVEQFVPVECSYSSGPAYSLSHSDTLKFEAALKRCKSEATKSSSVVGFFRSHLRDDVYLSPDDLTIIQRCFTDPNSVFLLIKTLPSRGCTAAFFFWEGGQIQPECAYSEVPLSPVQIGSTAYRVKTTVEFPKFVERLPGVRRRPRVGRLTIVGLAAVSLGLGAGGYWMKWGMQHPGTPVGADSLGLHIERNSNQLALIWNRNSMEVVSANRAVLSIRDGSYLNAFALNQAQLRSGVVTYKPNNQNIAFELELYRDRTQVVSDTLHVFLEGTPRATPAEPLPSATAVQATPDQAQSASTMAVLKHENSSRTKPLPVTSNASHKNDPSQGGPASVPSRIFKPPPRKATASFGSAVTGAPTDGMEGQVLGLPLNPKIDGVSIPAIPPELTQKINWPGAPASQAQPASKMPSPLQATAPAAPRISTYVGPQVLQRVNPQIAQDVRSKMSGDIDVDVTVTIDTNGTVTDAQVASMKGSLAGMVGTEALRAARLFRFKPARENDRNVVSKMTLSFRFRR